MVKTNNHSIVTKTNIINTKIRMNPNHKITQFGYNLLDSDGYFLIDSQGYSLLVKR